MRKQNKNTHGGASHPLLSQMDPSNGSETFVQPKPIQFRGQIFSTVVPVGEECYTSAAIDPKYTKNGVRTCAYPFDYVGHSYLPQVIAAIRHLCLDKGIFEFVPSGPSEKSHFKDSKFGFQYWHDKTYARDCADYNDIRAEFQNKINRRYARLKKIVHDEVTDPVLFFSVAHSQRLKQNETMAREQLAQIVAQLRDVSPRCVTLAVGFCDHDFESEDGSLIHWRASYNNDEGKDAFVNLVRQRLFDNGIGLLP